MINGDLKVQDFSRTCHDCDFFLLYENFLLVITVFVIASVHVHGWHKKLESWKELRPEHLKLAWVQLMLLDAEQAIELAVSSFKSSCNLLLLSLLYSQIIKRSTDNSEISLPLAVKQSPKLHLAIYVQEFLIWHLWLRTLRCSLLRCLLWVFRLSTAIIFSEWSLKQS